LDLAFGYNRAAWGFLEFASIFGLGINVPGLQNALCRSGVVLDNKEFLKRVAEGAEVKK